MSESKPPRYATPAPEAVSATDLKNAWHAYLDRVSRVGEAVLVTRYGKPIAKLVPIKPSPEQSLFGALSGTVTEHGDIVTPTGETWEADG